MFNCTCGYRTCKKTYKTKRARKLHLAAVKAAKTRETNLNLTNKRSNVKEKKKKQKKTQQLRRLQFSAEELSEIAKKAGRKRKLNIITRRKFDNKEYDELTVEQKHNIDNEFEKEYGAIEKLIKEKPTDRSTAPDKAKVTEKIATMITKWRVGKMKIKPIWQLVEFKGENDRESTGIIDILAVRKNHAQKSNEKLNLSRGDLLEIILIQVKGGTASSPSIDDIERLRILAKYYRAKNILLSEWKSHEPVFYRLKDENKLKKILKRKIERPKEAWERVKPEQIFG